MCALLQAFAESYKVFLDLDEETQEKVISFNAGPDDDPDQQVALQLAGQAGMDVLEAALFVRLSMVMKHNSAVAQVALPRPRSPGSVKCIILYLAAKTQPKR